MGKLWTSWYISWKLAPHEEVCLFVHQWCDGKKMHVREEKFKRNDIFLLKVESWQHKFLKFFFFRIQFGFNLLGCILPWNLVILRILTKYHTHIYTMNLDDFIIFHFIFTFLFLNLWIWKDYFVMLAFIITIIIYFWHE